MLLCVYINTAGHAQHNILVVNYARAGETSNVQPEGVGKRGKGSGKAYPSED